jgi:ADP-heptose:LPS heptosyltransferase
MKILAVSLLRAGDLCMTTGLLRSLKESHPSLELHLLINKSSSGLIPLLSYVDKFHIFDRDLIQTSLGEIDRSLFEGYDRVGQLVSELNSMGFHQVINLTHNRLSAHMCSLIESNEYQGLHINSQGLAGFGSSWFGYLNNYSTYGRPDLFHYSDIFVNANLMDDSTRSYSFIETDEGVAKSKNYLNKNKKNIVVQCFTSDPKKEWGVDRFLEFARTLERLHAGCNIIFLAGPNERSRLDLPDFNENWVVAECDLPTAYSVVKAADLLVTGDTVIKHLAAGCDTPVIELSLGSSQYQKTGIYKRGQIIIQSKSECAPCSHSDSCKTQDFRCRNTIEPSCVSLIAQRMLQGNRSDLAVIAEEYKEGCDIRITDFTLRGDWYSYSLLEVPSDVRLQEYLDRSSWRLLLNRNRVGELIPFGTESEDMNQTLTNIFGRGVNPLLLPIFSRLKARIIEMRTKVKEIEGGFKSSLGVKKSTERQEVISALRSLRDSLRGSRVLGSYGVVLDNALFEADSEQFVYLRKIQDGLKNISERSDIELKLIDTLSQNCKEVV